MKTEPLRPPFTRKTAIQKVQAAEDAWNSRDAERVSLVNTQDTSWRNRSEFLNGREEVRSFLQLKWKKEREYHLKKTLWSFSDNRISVKFIYEWRDNDGQWFRSYGNEQWEFENNGLMCRREAIINDLAISESERELK